MNYLDEMSNMSIHDEQGQEQSGRGTSRKKSPQRLELGTPATDRIVFALTLLGVLLPLNAVVNHYKQLDFLYFIAHARLFKGHIIFMQVPLFT